jgi:hypothetical protein
MSSDNCRTCKYVGYCTHPRSSVMTECKQFEDMRSAPSFDWDLKELAKLREYAETPERHFE